MSKHPKHDQFEEKVRAMAEGLRGMPPTITELHFRGGSMAPMQAALQFQDMLDGFQSIREAKAVHVGAIDAAVKALPAYRSFYEEAVGVVRSHFGSDAKRLASFGLSGGPRHGKRRGRRGSEPVEEVRTTEVEVITRGPETRVEVVETAEVVGVQEREGRGGHPYIGPSRRVDPFSTPSPAAPHTIAPVATSTQPTANPTQPRVKAPRAQRQAKRKGGNRR